MYHLFISDLHLTESRPDLTEAFFSFLEHEVPAADRFYILGDFFEVWLGDDHDTAFNRSVIERLATLDVDRYFMHGNRDFLIGQQFCADTGFQLLEDPTVIDLNGTSTLLMHGDSLCTRDEQYMAVRAMLRSPAVQEDLLSKSIEERAAIASGARKESQEHTRESADDIMDVTPSEVVRVMEEAGVSQMIHGHTHRPNRHGVDLATGQAERIVLGDWDASGWLLRAKPEGLSLEEFAISA